MNTDDNHGKEMVDFTLQKEYERSKALKEQNLDNIIKMPSTSEVDGSKKQSKLFLQEMSKNYRDTKLITG